MRLPLLALLLTTALPAQWDLQTSDTTAGLRGIHALGGGVAWASGTDGTVLRTTDDGLSWQRCSTPPAAEHLDFRGIQAFDQTTALVMSSGKGDLSRLYKTTDGCQTWKLVFTNPDPMGFWDAIQFSANPPDKTSRCFGVVVGDPVDQHFPLFLTLDCGASWERQIRESPPALQSGEGLFAASNSSLVVQSQAWRTFVTGGKGGARVLTFWVGGDDTNHPDPLQAAPGTEPFRFISRGWVVTSLPNAAKTDSSGAFSIADPGGRPVVVGGDYSKPELGLAWYMGRLSTKTQTPWVMSQTPPHGYRSAVAYSPDHKAWITVGPNGTDLSTDDGRNWRALKPGPTEPSDADKNWNALSLPFVVGPQGRIGRLRPDALPKPTK